MRNNISDKLNFPPAIKVIYWRQNLWRLIIKRPSEKYSFSNIRITLRNFFYNKIRVAIKLHRCPFNKERQIVQTSSKGVAGLLIKYLLNLESRTTLFPRTTHWQSCNVVLFPRHGISVYLKLYSGKYIT